MSYVMAPIKKEFEKDQFDAYMLCAEAEWKDMDPRRVYEWKVSFGLWAALGSFAGFVLSGRACLKYSLVIAVSVLLLIAGFLYTFLWIKHIRDYGARNLRAAHYFWDLAEEELGTTSPRKQYGDTLRSTSPWKLEEPATLFTHWASSFQISITWLLIMVALISVLPRACGLGIACAITLVVIFACALVETDRIKKAKRKAASKALLHPPQ